MKEEQKKGGNKGIRTLGPCLAKAVLYQLSYIPIWNEKISETLFHSPFFFKAAAEQNGVDHTGLEPVTSRLSSARSNQLS